MIKLHRGPSSSWPDTFTAGRRGLCRGLVCFCWSSLRICDLMSVQSWCSLVLVFADIQGCVVVVSGCRSIIWSGYGPDPADYDNFRTRVRQKHWNKQQVSVLTFSHSTCNHTSTFSYKFHDISEQIPNTDTEQESLQIHFTNAITAMCSNLTDIWFWYLLGIKLSSCWWCCGAVLMKTEWEVWDGLCW